MYKKKILFVDDQMYKLFDKSKKSTGGAAVQTNNWLFGFKSLGYSVKYTSVKKLSNDTLLIKNLHKSPKYFIWLFYMYSTYKIVKNYNPSIIYLSTAGWKTIMWAIIARRLNAKYIQRISNNIVFKKTIYRKKLGKYKYFLSKSGVRMADLILCQNKEQEYNLSHLFNKRKIEIVYNPYLVKRNKKKLTTVGYYIAWVGIFQYQKNIPELYNIIKNLPKLEFKIAGELKEHADDITKKYISNIENLPNAEFVGLLNREEIFGFLEKATCLLNTSHYEGFSNTYLEAIDVEIPIITRRKTDPDGIIEDNNCGLVCDTYEELPELLLNVNNSFNIGKDHFSSYLNKNHNPKTLASRVLKIVYKKDE